MPIQFRCPECGQLLSISTRKAGTEVSCPKCVQRIRVPNPDAGADPQAAPVAAASLAPPPPPLPSSVDPPETPLFRPPVVDEFPPDEPPVEEALAGTAAAIATHPGRSPAPEKDPWAHHPNPWKHVEDEEEDFQLTGGPLEESGLDMTPMVDVTFLLLIFFMITASFSMQKSLETTAPKPDEEGAAQAVVMEDLEDDSVIVSIDEENQIRVDDVPVAGVSELIDVLKDKIANENKTEMLIETHPSCLHGTVVAVTDAGLEVQMQRIRRASKKGDD